MKTCPSGTAPAKPGWSPGAECVCPTPTPSPSPSPSPTTEPNTCRYQWMCTYDCQGTPPGWDVPGKTGQDCVIPDDCFESVWTYDAGSSTERYQVYRKQTCEWVCEDDGDCFDHVPVTPDAPDFTPVQCPTPTPTDEPTPTPTVDPSQYYCICYCMYANNDCTGELIGGGYDCLKGEDFVEGCNGGGVWITIIGGPFPDYSGCDDCDWDCPDCP